ncbi:MAG: class I SAM-dependent methyltransferase, partial [Ignavibacteria bacterium]|nr:class I SAM-dependent methyltransferase [Ignavibacteria bacterium]
MQWYEELFKNYANKYENESFTTGTIGEVDFIENEIQHNKTLKILDIGCGTGRHSIELAKRGYDVTGIDLSESMLAKARLNATDQNVKVNF